MRSKLRALEDLVLHYPDVGVTPHQLARLEHVRRSAVKLGIPRERCLLVGSHELVHLGEPVHRLHHIGIHTLILAAGCLQDEVDGQTRRAAHLTLEE